MDKTYEGEEATVHVDAEPSSDDLACLEQKLVSSLRSKNEKGRLLTKEEELALSRAVQESHNLAARDELIAHNLLLVQYVMKHYFFCSPVAKRDLIHEGNIGLLIAAQRYNYKMGFRFATYAVWWIRSMMYNLVEVKEYPCTIRAHSVSLETWEFDEDRRRVTFEQILPDTKALCPLSAAEAKEELKLIAQQLQYVITFIVSNFHGREVDIFMSHFGLHGGDEMSYAELGKRYGCVPKQSIHVRMLGMFKCLSKKTGETWKPRHVAELIARMHALEILTGIEVRFTLVTVKRYLRPAG